MLYFYINSTDRTDNIVGNTLRITNQIQQRTDSCQFKIFNGSKPSENQDIKIYDGATVASHAGVTIVLQDSYQAEVLAFRPGQTIWLKIGAVGLEKATVATYTESTRTITLTAIPVASLSAGDKVGELIFGGVVARVVDENLDILANITYTITGVDYTKIFDKKIISDSWADVDSRYIINDFLNSTVNYQSTLDNLSYVNATAIRAVWIESGDGDNPNIDSSDFLEATSAGVFAWTFSGGTANWDATLTSKDLSAFVGAASGAPTKGRLMGWFKTSDQSKITSLKIRIGSDASNYAEFTFTLRATTDWQYHDLPFTGAIIVGTPDWTATDTPKLVITETASGTIKWNGLRINAEGSFTMYNVESTPVFDDLRSPQIKPMALLNQIAKVWEYVWYIDYERDIHFKDKENDLAPFEITNTSNNFNNLEIEVDTSNVGNRIIVRGGERVSTSFYKEPFEGNNARRAWILKNKFANLSITVDDGTSTSATEVGTTTTNIKVTGHGLLTGDYIINRTRSNAVREITKVDNDNFTVETVTAQTNGDTISKFSTTKTLGIEGLVDETTVQYVYNSNEKSVRATDIEATLPINYFILFSYNERVPIQIQSTDSASANALKALGLGDGVIDLDTITDRNITDLTTAITIAEAKLREFSNAIINGSFTTEQKGLRAGQILHIEESINRNINADYVIQQVTLKQREGRFKDNFEHSVTFGTTLFGWIEFMQKLLRTKDSIELNVDDIVETYVGSDELVQCVSVDAVALGGFKKATGNEIATTDDSNTLTLTTPPWHWETSVGQALPTRWSKFEWG